MHDAVEDFVEDLRRSKFAPVADQIEAVLRATDLEADYNLDTTVFFEAVTWIVGHTGRTLAERFDALDKLIHHDGSLISMRELTSWSE